MSSIAFDTREQARGRSRSIAALRAWYARPGVQVVTRALYYIAILLGLLLIYGRGDFSTPPFIYQGF